MVETRGSNSRKRAHTDSPPLSPLSEPSPKKSILSSDDSDEFSLDGQKDSDKSGPAGSDTSVAPPLSEATVPTGDESEDDVGPKKKGKSKAVLDSGNISDDLDENPFIAINGGKKKRVTKAVAHHANASIEVAASTAVDGAESVPTEAAQPSPVVPDAQAPVPVATEQAPVPAATEQAPTAGPESQASAPANAAAESSSPKPKIDLNADLPGGAFVRANGDAFSNNTKMRFRKLAVYANLAESAFHISTLPKKLEWSCARVKESRVIVKGQVTPVKVWCIGELTWNGMLPASEGNWPSKPKVSVKPLREADLMLFRKIVHDLSCPANPIDTSNIGAVSAHTDIAVRVRGSDTAKATMFPRLYDGTMKFRPDKKDMKVMRPADFMRGDIVLLEVAIGRYWDQSSGGRVLNWNSNRVYFQLDAVSLLVAGKDETDAEMAAEESTNHSMPEFM